MGWYAKPEKYECEECKENFEFEMDTLFIATHGGLPIKCPKCKSINIKRLKDLDKG